MNPLILCGAIVAAQQIVAAASLIFNNIRIQTYFLTAVRILRTHANHWSGMYVSAVDVLDNNCLVMIFERYSKRFFQQHYFTLVTVACFSTSLLLSSSPSLSKLTFLINRSRKSHFHR
jgi:hypothetical protein